jgi:hypothetical protein
MRAIDKKVKELRELLAFQAKCLECPRSTPLQREPPAPDIVFQECNLGIEITEYSLGQGKGGSQPRQLEVVHQRVARAAQAEYEATIKHCLQVSIGWAIQKCPSKQEEGGIAHAVAQLVAAQDFWSQKIHRIDWREFHNSLLKKFIHFISIFVISDHGQSCWSSMACFPFPRETHRIQTTLNEKEFKISGYRQVCRTVWLLIVANGEFLSSQFSPEPSIPKTRFSSSFDRVFLLETPGNSVHEINVEQSPQGEPV